MMGRGRVARRSPTLTHVHLGQDSDASRSAPLGASLKRPCRARRAGLALSTLEACYTRHTEPPGAITADVLRLLAAWVVRAVGHGLIANNPEGSPIR